MLAQGRPELLEHAAARRRDGILPEQHLLAERAAARAHVAVGEDLRRLHQALLRLARPHHAHLDGANLAHDRAGVERERRLAELQLGEERLDGLGGVHAPPRQVDAVRLEQHREVLRLVKGARAETQAALGVALAACGSGDGDSGGGDVGRSRRRERPTHLAERRHARRMQEARRNGDHQRRQH